jgi:hypothetical protein
MQKKFRENKCLNETGSKTGSWYLNRIDYFQFHGYPKATQHKTLSLLVGTIAFILSLKNAQHQFDNFCYFILY